MTAERAIGCNGGLRTGLAQVVLHEIAVLLDRLADAGEAGAIDLRSLPMTDGDRVELEERLGRGEVEATLNVAGVSKVWETRHAGVWWVRHLGEGNRVAAEEIAVTRAPEILLTHPADVRAAAALLRDALQADRPRGTAEERPHVRP
jgi:hydrogenase-1 operon protein HyaF